MYRFFHGLSRLMAYLGGAVLTALIVLTCLSVLGREVSDLLHMAGDNAAARWLLDAGIGPITGDFELTEAGIAFAIFAFLPYCQITAGHAVVDVFTRGLSQQGDRVLQAITDTALAAVLVLIAVQLAAGTQSKFNSGQTTFLIQFPLWWAYAASLVAAVIAAAVGVYVAVMRLTEAATGTAILPQSSEATH